MTSTTSAIASLDSSIAPRTDCSASMDCGGVRSNSRGPESELDGAGRASFASVMDARPPVLVRALPVVRVTSQTSIIEQTSGRLTCVSVKIVRSGDAMGSGPARAKPPVDQAVGGPVGIAERGVYTPWITCGRRRRIDHSPSNGGGSGGHLLWTRKSSPETFRGEHK